MATERFPSTLSRDKPNFLWVSFEDTNPRYGCYGDPVGAYAHVGPARGRGVPLDALLLHRRRLRSGALGHYHRHVLNLHRHPPDAHDAHQSRHSRDAHAVFGRCAALREVLHGIPAGDRVLL